MSARLGFQALDKCLSNDAEIYTLQISALTASGSTEFAANLYAHLVAKPEYAMSESRQRLVRRMREALVKCVSIMGAARPLEAIFAISKVEREEDKDYSFSRFGSHPFI